MKLDGDRLVKGEQFRANLPHPEAERDASERDTLETKTMSPELAAKTAEYEGAYKQELDYEKVSPYSDY